MKDTKCTDSDPSHGQSLLPLTHSIVSNDSVNRQWSPDQTMDAQADLGLLYLHMPKSMFSHGAANMSKNSRGHGQAVQIIGLIRDFLVCLYPYHLTLKLPTTTIVVCFIICSWFLKVIFANSVDPDQTAPRGAVWSGSTLFACMQK